MDYADGVALKKLYGNRPFMEFAYLFLLVYAALDAIILMWFFSAPLAVQSENRLVFGLGMLAYNYGYLTSNCHQMPHHTIILWGVEMPFCSRDTAIYAGCLLAALLPLTGLKVPRSLKSLPSAILLMAPMVVDGVTQSLMELRESTNEIRVVTGVLFGFGMVYMFSARIVENVTWINPYSELVKVQRITLIVIILLLACGYFVGADYVTKSEAVKASGLNPTFVTYAGKRATQTLRTDPFLVSYNDAVLTELREYGPRPYGVWVVYEGETGREGKYVYFSPGNGRFELIPDAEVSST